jgi:hypothetical protein
MADDEVEEEDEIGQRLAELRACMEEVLRSKYIRQTAE